MLSKRERRKVLIFFGEVALALLFLLFAFFFRVAEEGGEEVFGGAGDVGVGGGGEGEGAVAGEDRGGGAGEGTADACGTGQGGEVVEVGVPVHFLFVRDVFVFFFDGAGNALYVDEGAGVGVRKDALAGDEAGEVVDAFPGQGDGGEAR